MKTNNNNQSNDNDATLSKAIKVPIEVVPGSYKPHFFIKWDPNDKRYRVSASFRYLNVNYKLHINIVRNFSKLIPNISGTKQNNIADNIKFILSLIKNHEEIEIQDGLKYWHFLDTKNNTELFLVQREFQGDTNFLVVFFSKTYWSFLDYITEVY